MRASCPICGAWVEASGGLGATLRCEHGMLFVDSEQARFVASTPQLEAAREAARTQTYPRIVVNERGGF